MGDRCTGSSDGQHTWVPVNGGSDCSSCGATTALSAPRGPWRDGDDAYPLPRRGWL